jgi:hypothetical protein
MPLFLLTIFICLSLGFSQSISISENFQLQYKGYLGYHTQYFPKIAINKQQIDHIQTLDGSFELTLQTHFSLDLRVKPKIYFDLAQPKTSWNFRDGKLISQDRSIAYWEDLYFDWFGDFFELRAGYQTFSWKTVESTSWADILNQTDGQVDFFNAPKYGELAVRSRIVLPTEAEQFFEFYYLPYFTPTRYPQSESRYDFFANKPSFLNNQATTYGSSQGQWRPQYALRYTRPFLDDIDLSFFFFHGYDRSPILQAKSFPPDSNDDSFESEFGLHYEMAYMAGLTFQGALESWLLKGEFLGHKFENKDIKTPLGYVEPDPYLAYAIGFEYTFYAPIFKNHDLGTLLEFVGASNSGKPSTETLKFIPFQNHIFSGLRYTFNNVTDRAILLGIFSSWNGFEVVGKLEYEERILNHFKLKIGGFLLLGDDESNISQFESASRLEGSIIWNF